MMLQQKGSYDAIKATQPNAGMKNHNSMPKLNHLEENLEKMAVTQRKSASGDLKQGLTPTLSNSLVSSYRPRKTASEILAILSPESRYYQMSNARARLGEQNSPSRKNQTNPQHKSQTPDLDSMQSTISHGKSSSGTGQSQQNLLRNGSSNSKKSDYDFEDVVFEHGNGELSEDCLSVKMQVELENTKTLKKVANQFEKRSSQRLNAMGVGG